MAEGKDVEAEGRRRTIDARAGDSSVNEGAQPAKVGYILTWKSGEYQTEIRIGAEA